MTVIKAAVVQLFTFKTCGMPGVSRSTVTQKTHGQNGVRKTDTAELYNHCSGWLGHGTISC